MNINKQHWTPASLIGFKSETTESLVLVKIANEEKSMRGQMPEIDISED